jgi:hypothetical protein
MVTNKFIHGVNCVKRVLDTILYDIKKKKRCVEIIAVILSPVFK